MQNAVLHTAMLVTILTSIDLSLETAMSAHTIPMSVTLPTDALDVGQCAHEGLTQVFMKR